MRRHPNRPAQLRRVPESVQRRPEDMRQRYLSVALVCIAFALLALASCSSDNTTAPDGGMDVTPAPCGTLGANLVMCNGKCADTKHDTDNCGACGKKCGAAEVCVQGGCSLNCAG